VAASTLLAAPPVLGAVASAAASAMATAASVALGKSEPGFDPGCARARPYAAAASTAATAIGSEVAAYSSQASQPHMAAAADAAAADQPTCARARPYSTLRLARPSSREVTTPAASRGFELPAYPAPASDPPQLASARGSHGLPTAVTDGSPALFSPAQTGPGPSDQGSPAKTRTDQLRSGLLQVSQAACTNQQAVKQGDTGSIHGAAAAVINSSDATGQQAARELVAEDDGPSQEAIQVWQLN